MNDLKYKVISFIKNKHILYYIALFGILNVIALYLGRLFLAIDISFLHEIHTFLIHVERELLVVYFEKFNLLGSVDQVTLIFFNGNSLQILPGCSGLMQMFRLLIVLLFFPGPWLKKIWYIPLSMFLVFIAAIIHLLILSYVIIYFSDYYSLAYDYITKLLFYGMYFLIWLYWLERFVLKKKKKKAVIDS